MFVVEACAASVVREWASVRGPSLVWALWSCVLAGAWLAGGLWRLRVQLEDEAPELFAWWRATVMAARVAWGRVAMQERQDMPVRGQQSIDPLQDIRRVGSPR